MSVISRRSKSKTAKVTAKGAAKAAPVVARAATVAAPVAAAVTARAHDVGSRTGDQIEIVREQARSRAAALSDQASDLRDKAGPALAAAAAGAVTSASAAKDWAAPRLAGATEMSRAQLGTAYGRGVEAAAPRVAHAAGALVPKIDSARDHIVDDLLPRLAGAVSAGAAAAAAATGSATDSAAQASKNALSSTSASAGALAKDGTKDKKKSASRASTLQARAERETSRRRGSGVARFLLVAGILAAAGAAGYAAWKRGSGEQDPWVPATGSGPSGGSGARLSQPGSGEGLGAGTAASSSADVDGHVPDGVNATPDESGRTAPASKPAAPGTSTPGAGTKPVASKPTDTSGTGGQGGTGPTAGSVVPPRSNPPKAAGSTSVAESRAVDPETATARKIQAAGEASEVTDTVVRPAPESEKPAAQQTGKQASSPTQGNSGRPASTPGAKGVKPGDAKPAGSSTHAEEGTGKSPAEKKDGTANS